MKPEHRSCLKLLSGCGVPQLRFHGKNRHVIFACSSIPITAVFAEVSANAVYLYAPCGLSKRSDEAPLGLHRIAGKPRAKAAVVRAGLWVRTAWSAALERHPFEETYSGGFWGLLRKEPPPSVVRVCAVSAGFGLLPPGALIPNYDATFAFGSRNCVGYDLQANREWWRLMGHHASEHGRPTGITDAISTFPGIHILALPQLYLDSVWGDVSTAIQDRTLRRRVVVLTTPYAGDMFASLRTLTVSGGLRAGLGGTIGTVLPRLALRVATSLGDQSNDLDAIRSIVSRMPEEDALSPTRKKLSDADVRLFILRFLRDNPTASGYTSALRALRNKGLACEMKRFRSVFRTAYDSIHT